MYRDRYTQLAVHEGKMTCGVCTGTGKVAFIKKHYPFMQESIFSHYYWIPFPIERVIQ